MAEKLIPEVSTHSYNIPVKKLKKYFGIKGGDVSDVRVINMSDETGKSVTALSIITRQYKAELKKEMELIPSGEDASRG